MTIDMAKLWDDYQIANLVIIPKLCHINGHVV